MDAQLHTTSWAVEHLPIIATENMTTSKAALTSKFQLKSILADFQLFI